ncbi:MAG: O-phospho-L-seryl-tRNA:Cys-tRNA synthase, partial [Candidatus Bathyarchaeia archaeon]
IARTHRRRGYFFSDELKARKILGEFPGATREWKLNTYGLTWEQVRYLAEAFQEIARKYGIPVA